MKKLFIILISVVIIGAATYTVNTYTKNSNQTKQANNKADTSMSSSANGDSIKTTVIDSNSAKNSSTNSDTAKNPPVSLDTAANKNNLKAQLKDFKLKDLNGNDVSLSSLKGKNVYLNFWATWCPPCKAEMPDIEKLYEETKDTDLVILAVDIGEDKNTVKTFIDKNKYNFKILLDSNTAVAGDYNISAIPSSFFINKEGNLVSQKVGGMTLNEMREQVKAASKK